MTQAVVTRSRGDDFQARLFWLYAALLLVPGSRIARVSFESGPRAFDDVTESRKLWQKPFGFSF